MRLLILAVGHARGTPENILTEDFVGRAKARYGQWLGSPAPRRNASASLFGFWTEQDLGHALDRLNAYVVSAA